MLKYFSLFIVCILHISTSSCQEVKLTSTPVSCYGNNDGEIKVSVANKGVAYTLKLYDRTPAVKQKTLQVITTKDSTVSFLGLSAKKYYVLLIDAERKQTKQEIIITEPEPLVYIGSTTIKKPTSQSAEDGQVELNMKGGTPPYSYKWGSKANNQTSAIAINLGFDIYACEINDANNCGPIRPSILLLEKPITVKK